MLLYIYSLIYTFVVRLLLNAQLPNGMTHFVDALTFIAVAEVGLLQGNSRKQGWCPSLAESNRVGWMIWLKIAF